jgi:hypothetical protein
LGNHRAAHDVEIAIDRLLGLLKGHERLLFSHGSRDLAILAFTVTPVPNSNKGIVPPGRKFACSHVHPDIEHARILSQGKDLREGKRWDPLLPLLSERAAPIPEVAIQQHHHTHLGHDQEK